MPSAFSKNNIPETSIKRNTFDGSFQNNLTMKMGYLYPVLCKEIIPGDTFNIKSYLGLRFMPTFFPIQSKVKARLEFFYVRNRNLWKGFQNYYTGIGNHDGFPILSKRSAFDMSRTGSLGDYLGLPSTVVGGDLYHFLSKPAVTISSGVPFSNISFQYPTSISYDSNTGDSIAWIKHIVTSPTVIVGKQVGYKSLLYLRNRNEDYSFSISVDQLSVSPKYDSNGDIYREIPIANLSSSYYNMMRGSNNKKFVQSLPGGREQTITAPSLFVSQNSSNDRTTFVNWYLDDFTSSKKVAIPIFLFENGKVYIRESYLLDVVESENLTFAFSTEFASNPSDVIHQVPAGETSDLNSTIPDGCGLLDYATGTDKLNEATDILDEIPYSISALPFRAYEQIYNSFYRDDRNNPFILPNGEFDPNKFIPYDEGGVDDYNYTLHKRNWEQDFLSTALPSPQYGNAPLVGISTSGDASFIASDGSTITTKLSTDDNDVVVGFKSTNDSVVNRSLVELATSGISIADLRATNALQRYLEITYRRGLRYKDQILSHFGVDIKADILDMPEFLGGSSTIVDVSQVNQTSSSEGSDPLGSYAGQMSAYGESGSIRRYFDEPGYLIGILSVVPVPTYSQLVPKHFLKIRERLDFYMPEFGHLGYQPIRYDEVCPLQASVQGSSLSTVYGYQRAWYDYLANVDEIHGLFRTNLSHFVLSRVFKDLPALNESFLTVDPESLNEVFSVNSIDGEPIDTILGQIHFDIKMDRPIPRYSIPSIE